MRTDVKKYPGCNGPVRSLAKSAGVASEQESFQICRSCSVGQSFSQELNLPMLLVLVIGGGVGSGDGSGSDGGDRDEHDVFTAAAAASVVSVVNVSTI